MSDSESASISMSLSPGLTKDEEIKAAAVDHPLSSALISRRMLDRGIWVTRYDGDERYLCFDVVVGRRRLAAIPANDFISLPVDEIVAIVIKSI